MKYSQKCTKYSQKCTKYSQKEGKYMRRKKGTLTPPKPYTQIAIKLYDKNRI